VALISGTTATATAVDGSYNNVLDGSIVVNNITQLLRDAVSANPFNNRNPTESTTGVSAGFLANDLIFVPNNGIEITLKVEIDKTAFGAEVLNSNNSNYTTDTRFTNTNANYFGDASNNYVDICGNYTGYLDASGTDTFAGIRSNTDKSFEGTKVDANNIETGVASGTYNNQSVFNSSTRTSATVIQRKVTAPLLLKLDDSPL
jgi:hypothetical protein